MEVDDALRGAMPERRMGFVIDRCTGTDLSLFPKPRAIQSARNLPDGDQRRSRVCRATRARGLPYR